MLDSNTKTSPPLFAVPQEFAEQEFDNNMDLSKAMLSHLRLKLKKIAYVMDLIDFVQKSINDNCYGLITETTGEIFSELQSYGSKRLLSISYNLSMAGAKFNENDHDKSLFIKYCSELTEILQAYRDKLEEKVNLLSHHTPVLWAAV
jgi:hypothetical protein